MLSVSEALCSSHYPNRPRPDCNQRVASVPGAHWGRFWVRIWHEWVERPNGGECICDQERILGAAIEILLVFLVVAVVFVFIVKIVIVQVVVIIKVIVAIQVIVVVIQVIIIVI